MTKVYEMTAIQKNIWNIQKMYPDTGICSIGGYLHLRGNYDRMLLKKTVEIFLKRHSNFWCKVNQKDQIYAEKIIAYDPVVEDLRNMTEEEVGDYITALMDQPFAMYDSYLFDFRLLIMDDKITIFAKMHHLLADGYAFALFAVEQEKIYLALEAKEELAEEAEVRLLEELRNPVPPDVSYQEFFGSKKAAFPLFSFSASRQTVQAKEYEQSLLSYLNKQKDGWTYQKFHRFCRQYHTSLEAMVYVAVGVFFCKGQKAQGICIGRNLINRGKEDRDLFALRVNTLPYVEQPLWDMEIAQALFDKKKELSRQGSFSRAVIVPGDYPAMELEISYRPFRYMPMPKQGECVEYKNSYLEVPMKIFLNDTGEDFSFQVRYQSALFSEAYIHHLVRHLFFLLAQMLAFPERKVKDLQLLDENDRKLWDHFWNVPRIEEKPYLLERFFAAAETCAEKTALIDETGTYSYRETKEMVQKIAAAIKKRLAPSEQTGGCIGVCMQRSALFPVTIYAIWLSGNVYLPIGVYESEERRQKLAADCQLFLTEKEVREALQEELPQDAVFTDPAVSAYALYTSGTTGEAKAALISHRSLAIRIAWMYDTYGKNADVILQKTRNTFDVSIWELVLPFAYGKTLCMLSEKAEYRPEEICAAIQKYQVTMIHFVPAMFRAFISYIGRHQIRLPSLRQVILSGEAAEAGCVREAFLLLPQIQIANLYGPTECTIDVSYYNCTGEETEIPIGMPVYNTRLYVLDEAGELALPGTVGQLVIGGDLVGEGYMHEVRESGYRYRSNLSEHKVYDTGDLAELRLDGMLYYRGRQDSQVKIRGMRINLAEVEQTLAKVMPEVSHHVLCVQERIIDIYGGMHPLEQPGIRAAGALPYYCVPSEFCHEREIPVTKSGKTDKQALTDRYLKKTAQKKQQNFSKDPAIRRCEHVLLEIAQKILQRNDILLEDDLFEKGMDSLHALAFLDDCEEAGIRLNYEGIYGRRNLAELAKYGRERDQAVWLKQSGEKNLLLLIPYAGGSGESFRHMAQELEKLSVEADYLAVNPGAFGTASIRTMAKELTAVIQREHYEALYVMSSCVGSSLALEVSRQNREMLKGLLLAESLPYLGSVRQNEQTTVWDGCSKKQLQTLLSLLRGKTFAYTDSLRQQFLSDVKKSAEYLRSAEQLRISGKIVLVFGKKDLLTLGYRKRYRIWHRWLNGNFHIIELPHARHFLSEDAPACMAECIRKAFFSTEQMPFSEWK